MPVTWKADPLSVDVHAGELSKVMAEEIARQARDRIPIGQLSDGSGSQQAPKNARTDKNGIRGYDNGRLFAKRIKAVRQAAQKLRGEYLATLQLNPGKIANRVYQWLERETNDGVTYIHAPKPGSPGARELDAVVEKFVEGSVK